ncbi:hypothetical protein [Actinomadura litoris]|uniref:Uncharacterized protein n=1 Tax=Actinomadura litoris TaxID=2678616 RepID=A0A7K1L9F1_9ACTN|nr:hypothetical protein [Actinomadura litoris]MUN41050.1 hypothetical protein [Actinomadura litoris]
MVTQRGDGMGERLAHGGGLPQLPTGDLVAAMLGGILLGALPYLSYGLLPLYAVPLTVVVLGRPRLPILVALTRGLVAS